jgi:HTH-type transcriptional regulator / antitoxin HigA
MFIKTGAIADKKEKRGEIMTAVNQINPVKYAKLLADILPRVIASDAEYAYFEAKFKILIRKKNRTIEEDSIFDLLANLLEEYEKRTLAPLAPTLPTETLKFLMQANNLKQTDMVEFFGSQGNVSQVLAGKREIGRNAAEKLGIRFKVSPSLFLFQIP